MQNFFFFNNTLTPAFKSKLDASSGSKFEGIGCTGKSLVLMPRCWRDMCECNEFLDLATVPHSTHLYPEHTVCLSSRCVRSVWADRYILPHLGQGLGSVALTLVISIDLLAERFTRLENATNNLCYCLLYMHSRMYLHNNMYPYRYSVYIIIILKVSCNIRIRCELTTLFYGRSNEKFNNGNWI